MVYCRENMVRYPVLIIIALMLLQIFSEVARADDMPISGELTLFGVSGPDGQTTIKLDALQLAQFPQHTYSVETPWTNDETSFTGPLLRDVLQTFGVKNTENGELILRAHNDYSVRLPLSDAFKNMPILAMQRDGVLMTIRDNGPYWLIYPWHQDKSLRNEVFYARSVWMIKSISISNGNNAQ